MNTIISISAFAALTLLWLSFGAAMLFKRAMLNQSWRSFRRLPLLVQLALALLFLPVVLGLWIWQTAWPIWLRLALVISMAWMTIYTFLPKLPPA